MIHQDPTGGLQQSLVSTLISSLNEKPKWLLTSSEQHTDFGTGQSIQIFRQFQRKMNVNIGQSPPKLTIAELGTSKII